MYRVHPKGLDDGQKQRCEKPAVPYIVGIVGEFVGLLSMFLPYRCLYYGTPWGYYGALMLRFSKASKDAA